MNVFPKKIMLLGSGELGKEVAIAAKRLGCYVIACDRYNDAPAMQIADQFEVLNMNNDNELKEVIYKCNPDIIIPEIEALAVDVLKDIEQKITPFSVSFSLNVVATETESKTASTAILFNLFCS